MNNVKVFFAVAVALAGGALWGRETVVVEGLGASAAANRRLIQQAVDAAAAQGGGRIEIPEGVWPVGSVELKSGIELHLRNGAVLKGSDSQADYNVNDAFPGNFWNDGEEWSGGHLIYGHDVTDIALTGEGTVDGNGPAFFGECDEDSRWPFYKYGLKLHPTDRTWFRPGPMVAFFRARGVRIEGVSLVQTPCWTCHVRCCDGVTIRGVTIDADRTIANSDGFSIDCTRNVTVEKCVVRSGDDGFAIRASCRHHAATNFCENIVIRDCDIWSCCYAIRFGIGSGTIRNIDVSDTRIHEAAGAGLGFMTAWIPAKRNCHIEDIRLRNCTVEECPSAVHAVLSPNDAKIVGIRFEDCVFRTLLPMTLEGGDRMQMSFVNCVRQPIEKLRVRHRRNWRERDIRNGRSVFAEVGGDRSRIVIENCKPEPFGTTGILLLSFDDRNFADWEKAIPLFEKYGAHATFFVSGEFDPPAVRTAKRLMAAGHTIGLHGQHHANAPEAIAEKGAERFLADEVTTVRRQCGVSYIPVRTYAYPNCRHDAASDEFLLKHFDRLRAGLGKIRPYDPKGEKRADLKPLATDDRVFFPVAELPSRRALNTLLVGEAYNTDIDDLVACVQRAGARKEVLVVASHGISPDARHINMKTEWLEKILAAAQASGVSVLGYDEIPLETK